MARTPSTMRLQPGDAAPNLALPDTAGTVRTLDDLYALARGGAAHGLVVMFWCNHCPFVKHVRDGVLALAREYLPRGVAFVAINSNDAVAYPADNPQAMAAEVREFAYPFPYLFDESQQVARAYAAACTPDFFVFDAHKRLHYRGQLDDSRPGNGVAVTGADLRAALEALLRNEAAALPHKPSLGCNIKWKSGNEPASA